MKARLASFWLQAARSLGFQKRPPPKRRTSAAGPPKPQAALGWVTQDGTAGFTFAQTLDQSETRLAVRVNQPLPNDLKVWLVSPNGDDFQGTVESCDETDAGFRVGIGVNDQQPVEESGARRLGRVRLQWSDENGTAHLSMVAVENAGGGELEVAAGEPLPVPSIVLLSAYEYRGLGVTERCRQDEDHHRLTVRMMDKLYPHRL